MLFFGMKVSHVWHFGTPCTVPCQVPLSMDFSRPEYWSKWPFLSPGNLPNPRNEPRSPTLQVDFLPAEPPGKPILWHLDIQFSLHHLLKRQSFLHCVFLAPLHIGLMLIFVLTLLWKSLSLCFLESWIERIWLWESWNYKYDELKMLSSLNYQF